jgi:protein TonB
MKKLILLLLLCPMLAGAQQHHHKTSKTINPDSIYTEVQFMPRFDGDFNKYLTDHIQYPEVERDAGISGIVFVSYVIEKDGTVGDVKVMRGVPGGPGLDKEAVRVIKSMPAWEPGKQKYTAVRVRLNTPIHFQLR